MIYPKIFIFPGEYDLIIVIANTKEEAIQKIIDKEKMGPIQWVDAVNYCESLKMVLGKESKPPSMYEIGEYSIDEPLFISHSNE